MEKNDIIKNMPKILAQVKSISDGNAYCIGQELGMGITKVYYTGGTLCIDIYERGCFMYIVMVNISDESFVVTESRDIASDLDSKTRLLDIESLKLAFGIYEQVKGKKEYYNECMEKSCLRHLA